MKDVYFIQRLAAYFIDAIIITLVSSLIIGIISLPLPKDTRYEEAYEDYIKKTNEFTEKMGLGATKKEEKKPKEEEKVEPTDQEEPVGQEGNGSEEIAEEQPIDENNFEAIKEEQKDEVLEMQKAMLEYYEGQLVNLYIIEKHNSYTSLFNILICIFYYGTFQFFNKGQTLGKKLVKIKVSQFDKKKKYNHGLMILRSCINYGLIFNLLSFLLLLVLNENTFIYPIGLIEFLSMVVTLTLIIMAAFKKDGRTLSDIICNTKVISSK